MKVKEVIENIVKFFQEKDYRSSAWIKDYSNIKNEIAVIPVKRTPKGIEWVFTVHIVAHCKDLEALDVFLKDLEEIEPLSFGALRIDSGVETEFWQETEGKGYITKNEITCILPREDICR